MGMGVLVGPPRGELPPSVGDKPPPLRAWCRGREDMDMEVIPEAGEAIRLGSLQTEVGGATKAISGIAW